MFANLEKHLKTINDRIIMDAGYEVHETIIDNVFKYFIKPDKFQRVLDVGFGTGYSLKKFKNLGIDAIGISLCEKEWLAAIETGFDVRFMDMNFLDFKDKSFDLIYCRHSLEHSVMPVIALMEFDRVLDSKGYLYIEVPSDAVFNYHNEHHFSIFPDEVWQELFRRQGFDLIMRTQAVVSVPVYTDQYHPNLYWQYWLRKHE
jgi:ubiquinone/menaquinone biosynthesis C-methylase UbiE